MKSPGSEQDFAANSISTGYCHQRWDGTGWEDVSWHCVYPYISPGRNHPPTGSPGDVGDFACVAPFRQFGGEATGTDFSFRPPEDELHEPLESAVRPDSGPVSKLNLLYHVYPNAANDVWLRNIRQLRKRLGIFNGRKVVAIAVGPGLVHPDLVQQALAWPGLECLAVPNDRAVGQVASFRRLLETVFSRDPLEATFYAHTKGVANGCQDPQAIEYWRNAMYAALLDDPARVKQALQHYAAVGACKTVHPRQRIFPSGIAWAHWHFAGTFFWFRHDRVFGDFRWPFIPHDYYGAEAWLGGFLEPEEATSLLQPRPEDDLTWTGYDRNLWTQPIPDPPLPADDASRFGDHRISVVIPCKGRLAHLRQTLPYWLAQENKPHEILVVDYGCPERCGDWVSQNYPGIRVIRVANNVEHFNISRARNAGALQATGNYLCFADADFVAPPDYLERVGRQLLAGHNLVCIAHYDSGELGLNGICTTSAALYHQLRGYDESNTTYGFDDTDFYGRCKAAGASLGYLHNCQCISHTDEERMQFYPDRDKEQALRKAALWLADTSREINPTEYGQL